MLRNIIDNAEVPWITDVLSGDVVYIAELSCKIKQWNLFVGAHILLRGDITLQVTNLICYKSFEDAYVGLGTLLVPTVKVTRQDVGRLYLKHHKCSDVEKHGVVAIGIKVVCY